ncbi:Cytochrome c oxidase assembly protein CtaG [Candidatus Hodgkinia cicadicola]|uniref:Cytochrome c oxidase assembly protein CtaG n=1 Tax=Candidatus Hodgkinia cicadicola TaxID=573658 RepID=A0ABX4MEM9_9HYPH|nr:Cytochrome c oxidase assembly protein CtaG [Candidatus Hodgkinia cicadicola]
MYKESMIKMFSINSDLIYGLSIMMFIFMGIFCYLITKLYRITCTKFGLAGIPKKGTNINMKLNHKPIQIEFITQVDKTLPCEFKCGITHVTLIPGEIIKVNYKLKNKNNNYFVSEAIYNITPFIASKYFNKLQCFCYNKMIVPPCTSMVLPLVFYIDPNIDFDDGTKHIERITLTYILNNMEKW